ncbi:hypothetical protein Y1Q_0017754 [Alligator mississippiensis]|uniref:Uncharacterized protein n=1 Tax=Alligator mississippiensis TaxID=8496 RepID=A0A151NK63_ALLMI|nr:hypothetical protein Y1Q_0017754 [Alligator mississippiensis]
MLVEEPRTPPTPDPPADNPGEGVDVTALTFLPFPIPDKLFCPTCQPPRQYRSHGDMNKHLRRFHQLLLAFYCSLCGTEYEDLKLLKNHQKMALDNARRTRKQCAVAWLDISNGFSSVPHCHIFDTLRELGLPDGVINLVREIYHGCTMTVRATDGETM